MLASYDNFQELPFVLAPPWSSIGWSLLLLCHRRNKLLRGITYFLSSYLIWQHSCFDYLSKHIFKVFPGITPHLLVLEQMFWIPFFRDLWSTTGSVAATKVLLITFPTCVLLPIKIFPIQKGMESVLSSKEGGQAAVLVPGGAPEALNCDKGEVGEKLSVFHCFFVCFCLLVYSMCLFLSSL